MSESKVGKKRKGRKSDLVPAKVRKKEATNTPSVKSFFSREMVS